MCHRSISAKVAEVLRNDGVLDAALAAPGKPWTLDYRVKGLNVVPAPPIMPVTDMPVQFYGGKSRLQIGLIDQTNSIPAGAASLGIVPHIRCSIPAAPGDSGALLLSGHRLQPAFSSKQMSQTYIDASICSMLGMLVAGPPAELPANVRRQVYFTSILQILDQFDLEPWVRL